MKTHIEAQNTGGLCFPDEMRLTRCGQILPKDVVYKSAKRRGSVLTCKHCRKALGW